MAYAPAVNLTTSAGIAHAQQVYYMRKGLSRLMKKFRFRYPASRDSIPLASGRTVRWHRWSNYGAVVTPTVEGTVGTSQSLTSHTVEASVSQYSSYVNVSDFLLDTLIDPVLEAAADLLGYQGGLSVDQMTRTVLDNESASTNLALLGSYLTVADVRNNSSQLSALDVLPFEDNLFYMIVHPFNSYDLVNDPAAGGLADIFKYTDPNKAALVKHEERGRVADVGMCRIVESTNVKVTSGSPNLYRAYTFGEGAFGTVDLAGRGPSDVMDPAKQSFKINTIKGAQPTIYDPEGVIGGAVSYKFFYTAVVLDGPAGIGGTYRYRTMDCPSSIG